MSLTVKRLMDMFVALVLLVVLSPVMAAVAVLVVWNLGRPIFFVQMRPGLNGKVFRLFKFRTMREPGGGEERLQTDAERLGSFGKRLRDVSLDELPQLFNVIKGDMSLVGPRPLLVDYMALYSETQKRRHVMRPGITGWAQVNGRNALSWGRKFELDVWYVENWSLALDFQILYLTLLRVVRRDGISKAGNVTTDLFDGTN